MMRVNIPRILASATLLLLCIYLLPAAAFASATLLPANSSFTVEITEISTEIGDNFVRYPQLTGMADGELQQTINDTIVEEAKIVQRLITLSTLQQGGAGLKVSFTAYHKGSLFSAVISAKGMMENLRNGHAYTALSYNLQTGQRLQLKDFFTDPEAAAAWIEEQLLDEYADELSLYLEHADITPLPVDSFTFNENGLTFWYPYRQFALLSGYSGAVQFQYGELQDLLIREEDSVPYRLGAVLPAYTDAEVYAAIEAMAAQGTLPYVPVYLGDPLPGLVADYRLVRTPDQYPGGRYFQLESPAFRQVLILSDALTDGYEHSVVEGILATRMNLYGMQTGITSRGHWLRILGEPSPSVALDETISADYGLPPGTADYYTVANRQIMFYADADDVLYAIRLMK